MSGIAALTGTKSNADGAVVDLKASIATVTSNVATLLAAKSQHFAEQTTLTEAW